MPFRNRPLAILFLSLFVVMLGFGVIIPVLPFYVLSFGASSLHLGLLMASFSVMQLICAPYWGNLSDRIGRRPVLLIGLAGYAVSFLIMAAANALWMLFLARILGGALSSATLPTAMAYIGDTTSREDRGSGMGVMGAAMGLGMVFGPGIGGALSGLGMAAPFLFSAGLAGVVWCFAYLTLPESLAVRKTTRKAGAAESRLAQLAGSLRGPLATFFLMALIVSFGMANLEAVFAFFASDRLGYGPAEMGIVFVVMGLAGVLVQGFAIGRLINRFGEERVLQLGLVASALGFLLVTFAFDLTSLLLFVVLVGVGMGAMRPSVSSLLSKRTSLGQGATMGVQGSFDSLGRVLGPVWGGFIYQYGIQLPFLSGMLVFLFGLALMLVGPAPSEVPRDIASGPSDGLS
ncbi:MAG: MFS transporter [Chloroflexota bacterium]